MEIKQFIELISPIVVKSCNAVNLLPSPSIAQAIIESNKGESKLAVEANALFGIKADSRWDGETITVATKEYKDGGYVTVMAPFRKYKSWEDSIEDHTQFLVKNKRYSNLFGVRDYKEYCQLIKQDGYATSPTYDETLVNCIERYNLTQYDTIKEEVEDLDKEFSIRSFNIHAGHNPSGMIASGSIGYLNESDENRNVCSKIVQKIKEAGHTVYDCTCNNGTSQKDVLQKIVSKCNEHIVDLDISIHFNAIKKEYVSDGKNKGVEIWIHPNNKGTELENTANSICNSIGSLGFTNRGVKYSDTLYVLKNTKSPALLIECCFVDDIDDFALYDCDKMVDAIIAGLNITQVEVQGKELYYVIAGVYSTESGAQELSRILAENGYLMNSDGNLIKGIITQVKKVKEE